jgi:hypothetical protein
MNRIRRCALRGHAPRPSVSMLAVFVAMRQIAARTLLTGPAMAEHVRYLLEALRDDRELTFCHGHEPGDQVLIVANGTEQPSPERLRQRYG